MRPPLEIAQMAPGFRQLSADLRAWENLDDREVAHWIRGHRELGAITLRKINCPINDVDFCTCDLYAREMGIFQ